MCIDKNSILTNKTITNENEIPTFKRSDNALTN